jgi:hypothetical protein
VKGVLQAMNIREAGTWFKSFESRRVEQFTIEQYGEEADRN